KLFLMRPSQRVKPWWAGSQTNEKRQELRLPHAPPFASGALLPPRGGLFRLVDLAVVAELVDAQR
ncbi:MAG: hypothetical protein RLZZ136_553, partial [Pseudomonadota bacterium]